MTALKLIEIYCDGDEEHCPVEGIGAQNTCAGLTIPEKRRELKEEGWVYRGGRDLCPDCAARETEEAQQSKNG